jgi:2-polyprenyl-3-methyl-5-hydroxy-6-metoxy-1,4-benzoquinol methylase
MTPEEAIRSVIKRFPFEGYINSETIKQNAHMTIAKVALKYLRPECKLLDFGCGPCDKTAALQLLGFRCSGYDDLQDNWAKIPENMDKILAFVKESGIDFRLATDYRLPFEKNEFDMVALHDVLEHLHDSPRDLLNDLLETVKPEGLLFITVPNLVTIKRRIRVLFGGTNLPLFDNYYWYPGPWRGHVREYVRDDLVKLCKNLDLEILEIRGCDNYLWKLPAPVRPLYLFVTGFFPGWKDTWLLVARKKPGWVPRKETAPLGAIQPSE